MTFEHSQEVSGQCVAHLVTWFVPNRPVEGATVFVRPTAGRSAALADEQSPVTRFWVQPLR